ncbi:putative uncharacterized protein DDB_G0291812 [Tribolium madens]|uniref:putative uncharacterized protein DDB_G0291812 n=1 Tax=Tribolium madens TaxID=41895 RepID=UPI001CF747AB|nr:putative uncharacterized protein DDB_G0291812 [Tribolium madens]
MKVNVSRREEMSVKILISFISLIVCGSCQYPYYSYQYPYYGNYGYTNVRSNPYSYQPSPCRSSCGSVQPVNNCQYFPCYQRSYNSYNLPYAYNNNNYKTVNSNSNSNLYPTNPYGRLYLNLNNFQQSNQRDPYANVPTEIIDDDEFEKFMKKIPKLPKATTSSHSNYTVSQGAATSNSVVETKPIRTTINRSLDPSSNNTPIRLDFLNGEPINVNQNNEVTTTTKEETEVTYVQETTTIDPSTTEENEDVAPVKNWFS